MARIDKIFASGTIANVIFYERNGKPCARSRPARVRQTTATKASANWFGLAKTASRLLRQTLAGFIPRYRSRALMYRVDAGLLAWMQRLPHLPQGVVTLPGFACSGEPGFSEWCRLHILPVLDGTTLRVTLADLSPSGMPAAGSKALLTLVVSCIDPKGGSILRTGEQTVAVPWPPVAGSDPVLEFDVELPPSAFLLLSAALQKIPTQPVGRLQTEGPVQPPVAVVQGWYNAG
ncbi:hypothetical protein HRH25_21250 [Flavisolibacter sp. BT320]|nr:hypothetical protein [Flavisolibacter longurius]